MGTRADENPIVIRQLERPTKFVEEPAIVIYTTVNNARERTFEDTELRCQITELERCIETMKSIIQPIHDTAAIPPMPLITPTTPPHRLNESGVRRLLKSRAQRERYFGRGVFADPAWDMLLELFACE